MELSQSKGNWARRWLGEFLVIVVGVLTALAVDDFRQARADRAYERYVLERVSDELDADIDQIWRTEGEAHQRVWVINRLLGESGDSASAAAVESLPRRMLERTAEAPVLRSLRYVSQFDISDATYRELIATGGLQVVSDPQIRAAISRYYYEVYDASEGEQRVGMPAQQLLEETLAGLGVAPDDPITLDELTQRVSSTEDMVSLRRVRAGINLQRGQYRTIHVEAERFRAVLDSAGITGSGE